MTSGAERALFVTYEATRTGSPIVLLRLLTWLHAHRRVAADVLCLHGGPLVADYRDQADRVVVLGSAGRRTPGETVAAGLQELGLSRLAGPARAASVRWALRRRGPWDVVYLNGVPSFVALSAVRGRAGSIVGHVHELEYALDRSLPRDEAGLLAGADRYLAVSEAVRENLVDRHGVAPDRVTVAPGFVPDEPPDPGDPERRRAQLGIPAGEPVVGGAGDLIWRKGPDLFVALAQRLPDAHFVWVGGDPGSQLWSELHHDIEVAGLTDRVHLVGQQEDPHEWYALFDVLALTSREDPFPLVVLEAGRLGTPTVCFATGGAADFVRGSDGPAGEVVPPLDVAAMADTVGRLLDDPDRRRALGDQAGARVEAEYRASAVAPQLWDAVRGPS